MAASVRRSSPRRLPDVETSGQDVPCLGIVAPEIASGWCRDSSAGLGRLGSGANAGDGLHRTSEMAGLVAPPQSVIGDHDGANTYGATTSCRSWFGAACSCCPMAATPPSSQRVLLGGTIVLLPVILENAAHVCWLFRGKVTADALGYL